MEKWAKELNTKKDAFRKGAPVPAPPPQPTLSLQFTGSQRSSTADAGFAILEKNIHEQVNTVRQIEIATAQSQIESPLAAAEFGDRPTPDAYIDYGKLACLLCKRQFQSKAILEKHVLMSNLHKQNLAALGPPPQPQAGSIAGGPPPPGPSRREVQQQQHGGSYRDRAKERRQKYGAPSPPKTDHQEAKSAQMPFIPPQQTSSVHSAISGDNIGNKLLQKMGWNKGGGLGRDGSGIVNPITTQRRAEQAGLGAAGAQYADLRKEGSSYRENVKKVMQARFNEMRVTIPKMHYNGCNTSKENEGCRSWCPASNRSREYRAYLKTFCDSGRLDSKRVPSHYFDPNRAEPTWKTAGWNRSGQRAATPYNDPNLAKWDWKHSDWKHYDQRLSPQNHNNRIYSSMPDIRDLIESDPCVVSRPLPSVSYYPVLWNREWW